MRRRAVPPLLLTGALLLTGCGGNGAPQASGGDPTYARDATYTAQLTADPGNLDPHRTVTAPALIVASYAYDTLVARDPAGRLSPQLAQTWDVKPDSVTFTLRAGVTCADGTPVTASLVKRNFEALRNPKAPAAWLGVSLPGPEYTLEADDAARTFAITLPSPFSFLLEGAGEIPIVCDKGLKNPEALARGTAGSGPYVLTEAVPNDRYTLTRREGYAWGVDGAKTDAPGQPATVVLRVIQSDQTATNLLTSGQLNEARLSTSERERIVNDPALKVTDVPLTPVQYWFNQRAGHVTTDIAVRRALIAGANLQQVSGVAAAGRVQPSKGLVSVGAGPCAADTVTGNLPAYDATAAAAALETAGWTGQPRSKAGTPLRIRLAYPGEGGADLVAAMELLRQQWTALGVQVDLMRYTQANVVDAVFVGDAWDVVVLPVEVSRPSMLVPFLTGPLPSEGGQNFAGISTPAYGPLATQASATPGPEDCALWNKAEKAVIENLDVVPAGLTSLTIVTRKAEISMSDGRILPTSIRVLD